MGAAHARAARDIAVASIASTHLAWIENAIRAVRKVARSHMTFTTDELWPYLKEAPRDPRAMGPVMLRAQRLGLCVSTNLTRQSSRTKCHARPLRVWYSLTFKTAANTNGRARQ